jgi:hypothetical protein
MIRTFVPKIKSRFFRQIVKLISSPLLSVCKLKQLENLAVAGVGLIPWEARELVGIDDVFLFVNQLIRRKAVKRLSDENSDKTLLQLTLMMT